ncbi:hypothetical protein [Cronobacter sakazakii]|uniref:hypothetical protein n=1 Tax=Cronobacter sakazakii TaxID=28141 RepID=UPI0021A34C05|nr:hypothetical protein [Cronobacter sakazakii]UWT86375.1 hypothetical protein N1710_14315 [Cronobacter sakazakii]
MEDLIVQRYDIVTVHRHGEMYDELREKPNGKFCYYKEANESHKEVLAEYSEPVNESLLEALQEMTAIVKKNSYPQPDKPSSNYARAEWAESIISKALGEE